MDGNDKLDADVEEAPGKRRARRRRRPLARFFVAVLIALWILVPPALAVDAIGIGSVELPAAIRAARGHGRIGTFAVTYHSCGRYTCTWQGDFISNDGTDMRRKVDYTGSPPSGTKVGDRIRAIDTGSFEVYQYPGSLHWLLDLFLIAFGCAFGGLWGYGQVEYIRKRKKKRRQMPSTASQDLGRAVRQTLATDAGAGLGVTEALTPTAEPRLPQGE